MSYNINTTNESKSIIIQQKRREEEFQKHTQTREKLMSNYNNLFYGSSTCQVAIGWHFVVMSLVVAKPSSGCFLFFFDDSLIARTPASKNISLNDINFSLLFLYTTEKKLTNILLFIWDLRDTESESESTGRWDTRNVKVWNQSFYLQHFTNSLTTLCK